MELLVVRHAIAEDREVFARTGEGDAARPLTGEGRRRFEKGARGLRRLVDPIDLLATSPLARAVETGALLSEACRVSRTVQLRELSPGAAADGLLRWLRGRRARATVTVVGHEPQLSQLVALLLAGRPGEFLELKKGGACLLTLDGAPAPGHAELRWLLTPSQLRRLR